MVSVEGDLLGFGRGTPPHWCTTAAAAEAWALQEVLAQCPFPPQMRTDCQALLATVTGGVQRATAADKKLARIWRKIANMLGGCFKRFRGVEGLGVDAGTPNNSIGWRGQVIERGKAVDA